MTPITRVTTNPQSMTVTNLGTATLLGDSLSPVIVTVAVGSLSGTSPVLSPHVEQSLNGATLWTPVPDGVLTPLAVANHAVAKRIHPTQPWIRVVIGIAGTTPQATVCSVVTYPSIG